MKINNNYNNCNFHPLYQKEKEREDLACSQEKYLFVSLLGVEEEYKIKLLCNLEDKVLKKWGSTSQKQELGQISLLGPIWRGSN